MASTGTLCIHTTIRHLEGARAHVQRTNRESAALLYKSWFMYKARPLSGRWPVEGGGCAQSSAADPCRPGDHLVSRMASTVALCGPMQRIHAANERPGRARRGGGARRGLRGGVTGRSERGLGGHSIPVRGSASIVLSVPQPSEVTVGKRNGPRLGSPSPRDCLPDQVRVFHHKMAVWCAPAALHCDFSFGPLDPLERSSSDLGRQRNGMRSGLGF